IGDALEARIASLGTEAREVVELAAVLGETFELGTLVAAAAAEPVATIAIVDVLCTAGLIEENDPHGRRFSFIHALTRQAVVDRLAPSRRTVLHGRVAEALEREPADPSIVPRLAHHYLSAHVLGFHENALRYCRQAGQLAEHSLAFEDAAVWFERAASLPECAAELRAELLLASATDFIRSGDFAAARAMYERLATSADPLVGLAAAMGVEDATWRPGLFSPRVADLLSSALERCGLDEHDPRYVRGLAALGRALALAGETVRARQIGGRAIELARQLDDEATLMHALMTSLWHGTAPELADTQFERSSEAARLAERRREHETLGAAANFRAMVSYLSGRPDELRSALADSRRAAQATNFPYFRYVYCCLAHADAFRRGDFRGAERWAEETIEQTSAFSDEMTEGPHAVQLFMVRRETGGLARFRGLVDGSESFAGRWVPGLLALYSELDCRPGMERALRHLLERDLTTHTDEAQWPMELVFMVEAALVLGDARAVSRLRPFLAAYGHMNIVSGTLIASFGSADRYLARIAAALGELSVAEQLFEDAVAMDEQMGSVVHQAETLAHQALFLAATGRAERARAAASQARRLAAPIRQARVLALLDSLAPPSGPDGLSERELDVLRLLASGLSNQEIGTRLHISANTAANHIRSILAKTGAANRTQAAMYAAQHQLA
ncbi:MAG TPA: LuxR C-terminal-related transcriptional regulator, partial [Acidimicrobiales bacterium]|nr:LuxR C-terminal-related transcriptional regulator [Acidimicrobiales bacterium]